MFTRSRRNRRLALLSLPVLLAFAGPASAETPSAPKPGTVTRARDTEIRETSFTLDYDPSTGKIYLLTDVAPLELTDHYLGVCYDLADEIDVTFRVYQASNWYATVNSHYDQGTTSEQFVLGHGISVYAFPTPDPDDIPTLDVFLSPNVSEVPTSPVIVIQPIPTCPDKFPHIYWTPVDP